MSIYVDYDQLADLAATDQFTGEEVVVHREFVFFWKPQNAFGQWTDCVFEVDDILYSCAEQFMMAEKARLFGADSIRDKIIDSESPREHKRLGREVAGFKQSVWEAAREEIVYRGNLAKFSQNEALRTELLDTQDLVMVEASPFDKIWGIGLRADDPRAVEPTQWQGLNLLGNALMRVRGEIRAS